MNRDKQIEEMAVKCCRRNPQAHTAQECLECGFKNGMCDIYKLAKMLYEDGYRKTSEIAAEIFAEIEEARMQHTFGNIDGSELNVRLYYLKKKYLEVDNEQAD